MFLLAFEYEYKFEFNELTGFELNLEHVYTILALTEEYIILEKVSSSSN